MDDLQKAYTAYQQALYRLPNPKVCDLCIEKVPKLTGRQDPKLWYGIGILYDRYGSLEHAEEAFSSVLRMEPSKSQFTNLDVRLPLADFDKANEVYFRLGIIYKTQQKFKASLEVSLKPAYRTWLIPRSASDTS
jgi:glucose repression mediator protein